jgi:hypothetical protein
MASAAHSGWLAAYSWSVCANCGAMTNKSLSFLFLAAVNRSTKLAPYFPQPTAGGDAGGRGGGGGTLIAPASLTTYAFDFHWSRRMVVSSSWSRQAGMPCDGPGQLHG